jgi:hypothetical protein
MATLELDQHTVERLNAMAAANGMTPEAYLKSLLPASTNGASARLSFEELDSLLRQHAFDGPNRTQVAVTNDLRTVGLHVWRPGDCPEQEAH